MTSVSRWLMIVSIAIAVFPVERSPMMSSRWPAADGDHRVDRLESRLERLRHGLPQHDPRRNDIDPARVFDRVDRPGRIHRIPESPDDPARDSLPDRDLEHPPGAPHLVSLVEIRPLPQDHGADVVFFEIERECP